MTEKTDVQSPGTDIHKMGAHQAVSRTKGGARINKVGPAKPQVRPNLDVHPSKCILAGDPPLSSQRRLSMFPYQKVAGTDLLNL